MDTEQQAEEQNNKQFPRKKGTKPHELLHFTAFCFLFFGLIFIMNGMWYGGMRGVAFSVGFFLLAVHFKRADKRVRAAKRKNIWQ